MFRFDFKMGILGLLISVNQCGGNLNSLCVSLFCVPLLVSCASVTARPYKYIVTKLLFGCYRQRSVAGREEPRQ